jgi:DNA-binding CsgD family transcriptional regulator
VPDDADIVRARATVFEAWVAFERAEPETAVERFRTALQQINAARHYDRFVEASAIYGLAFLCAELPRVDLWPELRRRVQRFDWSAPGVVLPQFYFAMAASYVTEMRGEFNEAEHWASRAQSVGAGPAYEILCFIRLAALTGRYGEGRAHAHFIGAAQRRYGAVGGSALAAEDFGLPLALAEEIAQGTSPLEASAVLTFHREVIAPCVARTKDEAQLAAADALVQGLIDDASGRRSRALGHYRNAFARYDAMGYQRRAAIAAYRIALLDGSAEHRRYVQRVVTGLHPEFWLSERLASFGVQDVRLSERQVAVLRLLAAGKSNKEIASERGGSWYTARNVVRELITIFGVRSRSELVRVAIARGILPPRDDVNAVS